LFCKPIRWKGVHYIIISLLSDKYLFIPSFFSYKLLGSPALIVTGFTPGSDASLTHTKKLIMKQITFLMMALFIVSATSFSQSGSASLNFRNALRPALVLPLIFKTSTAEQTILAKLKETGYKPEVKGNIFNKKNKQEGYYVFNGVQLPELANQKLDLYFKVDKMDSDSGYNSSISLLVSKGYDNFISEESDSTSFAASRNFLNSFVSETASFLLNKQMDDQKASIVKAEKKWQDTRKRQEDTRNKIAQLEADLKNLQTEELTQQEDVNKQRAALGDLENKRSAAQN